MTNFTTAPDQRATAREHALQAALRCIVLETMDCAPQRPFSSDSYPPEHLVELAQEALQPAVQACAPSTGRPAIEQLAPDAQAAIKNALAVALHYVRQPGATPAHLWAATARTHRALVLLQQVGDPVQAADGKTASHAFARRMARFEIDQARRRLACGRPDRAAVALSRARLWRLKSHANRAGDGASNTLGRA